MVEVAGKFDPQWVSPPGDTILDLLEERGWPQSEFAERTAYTPKHVSLLVNGKAPITEDTAFRLERVLGGTAQFWLSREANYREAIARENERASLRRQEKWLREIPLAHMIRYKWVDKAPNKATQVAECLSFFGACLVDAWRRRNMRAGGAGGFQVVVQIREENRCDGAWLRGGEREAHRSEVRAVRRTDFQILAISDA